jgi:sulfur relay (sulfurtransferase) complex TusBCD TusD component (DsrE family)
MKRFLVVGSRDLTEYVNGEYVPLVVEGLRAKGHEVTLFLIENGVIAAREGSKAGQILNGLSDKGARVYAEDVSCRARGVRVLAPGVSFSNLDSLADSIAEGFDNIVWY